MLGSGLTGRGSGGADTLHSNGGPNTLEGRDGDDVYYVNNSDDAVIEEANGGHDTVVATRQLHPAGQPQHRIALRCLAPG